MNSLQIYIYIFSVLFGSVSVSDTDVPNQGTLIGAGVEFAEYLRGHLFIKV